MGSSQPQIPMNHRYTLPVTLALALHASLFGYRPSVAVKLAGDKLKPEEIVKAIDVVPLEDPVVPSEDTPVTKGRPTYDIATLLDTSVPTVDRPPFVIEV